MSRLKAELEQKELSYEESLTLTKAKYTAEMKNLAEQLHDVELSRQQLLGDITALRDREEQLRRDIVQEQEEAVEDLHRKWDRDHNLLVEAYEKACVDRDTVCAWGGLCVIGVLGVCVCM